MWIVCLCAFMAVLQSALSDSFSSLLVAISAVFGAVLTEFLFLHARGRTAQIKDGSAVATGLILALLLPNRLPPLYAIMGAAFAVAVVKQSFGGLGSNWVNPAAGGWLFVRCSWPGVFTDVLEGSLPGIDLQAGIMDTRIRSFLNEKIFSHLGAELPPSYIDLFASSPPGIIADRGVLALLLGTVIITSFRVNRTWIPLLYLVLYGFLVRCAGAPHEWRGGDVLFAFSTGGSLVAAFILNAEPAASAKSTWGVIAAIAASAFLTWFFRCMGGEPYGAVFALVFVNALFPMVRTLERYLFYEKRNLLKPGAS
jgi:electron transport complex protein RnfD